MNVPLVNLRPAVEATARQWRARLAELFEQMHFVLGHQVASFEREFAAQLGARFAVGVGSGTDAIELCLREAGLTNSGRHVITSPLTAPFTGLAILGAGCAPRFAEVDPETALLDPGDVENRATRKTAAIIPVHLYGQPCDLRRFASLAKSLCVVLVQDACQAHGARFEEQPLTDFSDHVAYSFYPTKNLGCLGDGGAVVTNRGSVAKRLRLLRDGGRTANQVSRLAGINSRLDEMQACYLRAFLSHLEEWNTQRDRIASIYDEALRPCSGVRLIRRPPGSVHHLYVIRAKRRTRLREYLSRHGIGTGIHYPVPLHLQPAFRDCGLRRGDLPHSEQACREIVSLPLWPYMPETAAHKVAERVRAFYR
jgi:dTDP-4-amino-4,6-dideoxygalactose transaminase